MDDATTAGNGIERNRRIAGKLAFAADLLAAQGADPFRVAAYRRAAEEVRGLDRDLGEIDKAGGRAALDAIPNVGPSIARAIAELIHTGRWGFIDHLRGAADPEKLFRTVPGIGPSLARRLHETLHLDTLEALEEAAHDGRLEQVPGLGGRRAAAIRGSLAEMLARVRRPAAARGTGPGPSGTSASDEPEVALLLDVDREYREKGAAGSLPQIAPKRFNRAGEAWLPILHTRRGPWHLTALYSNTARAHALDRVRDWVILYFHLDGRPEEQRTVVTETHGPLTGRRVVRGREAECRRHYGVDASSPSSDEPVFDLT